MYQLLEEGPGPQFLQSSVAQTIFIIVYELGKSSYVFTRLITMMRRGCGFVSTLGGSVNTSASVSANVNSIPLLNGTNFKESKENMYIVLGCMDLDLLRTDKPPTLTDKSFVDEKQDYEKWDRSNRMCLMIMKRGIPESFRGSMSDEVTAKEFLAKIEKLFVKNDKAEISTTSLNLISMRYKDKGNIREYIMEMSHLASKLKALKLELSEDLLVHLVLVSLPAQFNQFKISYNCQKEKWSLNELISHCVQEEERLKQDKTECARLVGTSKGKQKKRKMDKEAASAPAQKKHQQNKSEDVSCYFCKKTGHLKKNCTKYHAWRANKGLPELPKAKL